MEFKEVIKNYKRMCNAVSVDESCGNCAFGKKRGYSFSCQHYLKEDPEYFEDVVKKWSEDHPIITNAMKLEEVFGCSPISNDETIGTMCPPFNHRKCLQDEEHVNKYMCDECRKWWDEEYKEKEVEENG